MSLRLAIVILNYRTPRMSLDCLSSLAGQMEEGIEVVVVDNDSGDGSAETIEEGIARAGYRFARVMRSPINGGFAAGNNHAIRAVDADAYLLLNSDTIVRPGAVASLLDAMAKNPRAGLVGPSMEDAVGRPDASTFRMWRPASELARGASIGAIGRLFPTLDLVWPTRDTPTEPDWIGFACVLVRRAVIDEVGLLDEGYFMYFEDVDYCRRVRDAGWSILYWPEARIVHLLGGSSDVTARDKQRRRAPRYYYEARARYFAKFHGRLGLWMANVLFDTGRAVGRLRERLSPRRSSDHRAREALDVWTNALRPLRPPLAPNGGAT
ncbi:MAG: glycosyltransferase family 2 protein [Myxococcales bacterium]|nr:glycosyltransferase family 2 protein [Myxococcales bacterium]